MKIDAYYILNNCCHPLLETIKVKIAVDKNQLDNFEERRWRYRCSERDRNLRVVILHVVFELALQAILTRTHKMDFLSQRAEKETIFLVSISSPT